MHGTLNASPRSGAVPGSQAVQGKSGMPAISIVYQLNYYNRRNRYAIDDQLIDLFPYLVEFFILLEKTVVPEPADTNASRYTA